MVENFCIGYSNGMMLNLMQANDDLKKKGSRNRGFKKWKRAF